VSARDGRAAAERRGEQLRRVHALRAADAWGPEPSRKAKRELYRHEPSGGLGAFTPDSFPVFDRFRQNAYLIADSNHGYKMIGVGEPVAGELLGEPSALLEPFRFARYETGRLHPTTTRRSPGADRLGDQSGFTRPEVRDG
jgi:hypothetical protein